MVRGWPWIQWFLYLSKPAGMVIDHGPGNCKAINPGKPLISQPEKYLCAFARGNRFDRLPFIRGISISYSRRYAFALSVETTLVSFCCDCRRICVAGDHLL